MKKILISAICLFVLSGVANAQHRGGGGYRGGGYLVGVGRGYGYRGNAYNHNYNYGSYRGYNNYGRNYGRSYGGYGYGIVPVYDPLWPYWYYGY